MEKWIDFIFLVLFFCILLFTDFSMKFQWLSCEDDVTWCSWRWFECLTNSLMTNCHHIIIISTLRENRDVCLIETINHITTNNWYCFSFYPWKHFCLSCFVGYRRSILCTFEISFHRFHSSLFALCVPIWCVFLPYKNT